MSDRYVYADPALRFAAPRREWADVIRLTGDWTVATAIYRAARLGRIDRTGARHAAIVALVTSGGTARGGYWSIPRH